MDITMLSLAESSLLPVRSTPDHSFKALSAFLFDRCHSLGIASYAQQAGGVGGVPRYKLLSSQSTFIHVESFKHLLLVISSVEI